MYSSKFKHSKEELHQNNQTTLKQDQVVISSGSVDVIQLHRTTPYDVANKQKPTDWLTNWLTD